MGIFHHKAESALGNADPGGFDDTVGVKAHLLGTLEKESRREKMPSDEGRSTRRNGTRRHPTSRG
jgi:hypothetical protein